MTDPAGSPCPPPPSGRRPGRSRRAQLPPYNLIRVTSAPSFTNKETNLLTSFRPVVACTALAEHKVVRAEEVAERAGADIVHSARLEVDEHGAGHVLVGADFVVVDVDTLELKVGRAFVYTIALDPVLLRDDFPELGTCERKKVSGWYDRSRD